MRKKRIRRWWKVPEKRLQKLRRLLLETDYSIEECLRRAGCMRGKYGSVEPIIASCRRSVGNGRWVDRTTGELRPRQWCTETCAALKIGLSVRTVRRRIAEGLIQPATAPSHTRIHTFDEKDIQALRAIGRKKPGTSTLSPEDVTAIRELAAHGLTHAAIAERYPVSRRQISRIVSGERWAS